MFIFALKTNQPISTTWANMTTAALAKQHAENEFEKYRPIQDRVFESDFDRAMKVLENNNYLCN